MDHYLEITLLPDPEFEEQVLLNALFSKFHRGASQAVPGRLGISFPRAGKRLGGQLRIHGGARDLDTLMATPWLKGLGDYCQVSDIQPVPEHCQYRTVRRVQTKSAHNKRKRSVAKGWLTVEEAYEKIPDDEPKKRHTEPFVQIKSLSSSNTMRVYIQHGDLQDTAVSGEFSSYGLSATTTIPWF